MRAYLRSLPRRLLFALGLGVLGYLGVAETTPASDREAVYFALVLAGICIMPKAGKRRSRHHGPMGADDGGDGGGGGGDGGDGGGD